MAKLKLLTTTAIFAGAMTLSVAAHAESQSWWDDMTTSVQSWFQPESQIPSEVEAYLDEVTIAVPPMTGEEASQIEPAAGDYQETLEEALENDEQSFNTEFDSSTGSVAAFEDPISAEDMANIMPAAGGDDAEEINDEAIIVVEEVSEDMIVEDAMDMSMETEEEVESESEAEAEVESESESEMESEMEMDALTESEMDADVPSEADEDTDSDAE